MADYALSFHDLMLVDGFKEAYETQNKKVFEAILQTNGFDIKLGYELVACNHRTINKIEYYGIRVEGFERTDKAWIATGCASIEAQIEATNDKSLRHTLRAMSYQGTLTPTDE
ncbi:hypothetical protein QGX21_gp100 [Pseudomonas phage phiPsa315]|uniref:Uncharacterized protein n=1 Tax=Pseudomonas phage phiPsa315 TaxID=1460363 RepID=A0A7G9V1Z0_9CAUD|nr:hypothetical protein QGX21_gp100 [Pseudomonas phage phiPsa315]QNO00296.1 hypothetical protein phiPsa315_126 [Pseudomonas phage phiPsa315]